MCGGWFVRRVERSALACVCEGVCEGVCAACMALSNHRLVYQVMLD